MHKYANENKVINTQNRIRFKHIVVRALEKHPFNSLEKDLLHGIQNLDHYNNFKKKNRAVENTRR